MRQELEDLTTRWEAPPGAAASALIVLDDSGRVVEWNPAAEGMFRVAPDTAIGQRLDDLGLPAELGWQPLLEQARATRVPQRTQVAALPAAGAERYVQFSIAPLPAWGGAGGGILLLGEDVTAQVRARVAAEEEAVHLAQRAAEIQALRETAIALSSSLDQGDVLQVVCDRGRKLLAADFVAALVPYNDPHWMEGGSPAGSGTAPMGEPLTALLRRVLPTAETLVTRRFPAVPLVLPKGGTLAPWEGARSGVAVPLRYGGEIQGVVIFGWRSRMPLRGEGVRVAEALGAHASLALRNARMYNQMRQTAERRDRFFSAMSHDLRTPITAIVGYSELLLDGVVGELGAREREMVDRISQVAGHLSQLVNDILDLAKLEAGRMEFHREPIRLEALVEDAIVAVEPQADAKQLALIREFEDTRNATLWVDRIRVRQVLVNLLSNAVKFTPAGEIRVSAALEPERAWIAVRDTGPGLGEGDHEALFEEFLQVASGTGIKSEPGTGLGLAISRRLARAMGGDLLAENAPGGGALFTLVVPHEPNSPASPPNQP